MNKEGNLLVGAPVIQLCCMVLAFFVTFKAAAQQTPDSSTSDTLSLKAGLLQMESEMGFRFYFLESWLEGIVVSKSAGDEAWNTTLERWLTDTNLNFYFIESQKRVVLLQNSVIYDELPGTFFGPSDLRVTGNNETPMATRPPPAFLLEKGIDSKREYPLARIGKADDRDPRNVYSLKGRATNSTTGDPIPDLVIRVEGSNAISITDENGEYSIQMPAGYNVLTAGAMGVADMVREVVIYSDGTLNLVMEEGFMKLEEVTVEADAKANVEETGTGTESIDLEESKDIPLVLGERDLLQVAKLLPGISSAGEGATGLNVRGGKTDQNLVLLDDAVIYNPTHFFGIFQALNPFTTEGADIYKGSVPVEFGGRLSSVFDIRTKNGNENTISGEGSIGPVTANVALEIPVKKDASSLVLGGRAAYANWILRSLEEESLNKSQASFFDVIGKYHHRFNENSELRGSVYFSRDDFSITSDSLYNYTNRMASIRWNHQHSEKTIGALTLANSDYRFGIDFDGEGNTDFMLNYSINETELKYKLRTRLSDMHTLDYGVSSKLYSVNPGSIEPMGSASDVIPFFIDEEQAVEGALFLGDNILLTDKLSVDLGLRYAFFAALGPATQRTYIEGQPRNEDTVRDTLTYGSGEVIETYGGPEARVSLRYLLRPDFSVKASFNNAYQFIHTLTNNTTVSPIDTWKLSDLNIAPQTGYQVALGFYKNFKDNMFEVSLEGYYKGMDNVLDFKTGADLFLNENVETELLQGDGKAYGVELLIKKNRGQLTGWLGYTYSRSFYRFDSEFAEERINGGEFFPSNFDKPHDVSLIANYRFTRRYSVSANFVYQTGRPVTYPVGTFTFANSNFVAFSDRNEFRIPDFFRLDVGFSIKGNHKKDKLIDSYWNISVYNILGRNNPYSVFFVTEGGEIKALQSSIFTIPIPSITYNLRF